LSILENARIIAGHISPEYTSNLRLLKEVRYGTLTKWGKALASMPRIIRLAALCIYLQKQRILELLGTLAFLRLAYNAYSGAILLAGWFEYGAALLLAYLTYLGIRKVTG
jgi:hypothetical protein